VLTIVQTLAGAAQFDGTAGAGLFDFSELDLPVAQGDICPVLTAISYDCQNAESIPISCFLRPSSEANNTTVRRVIFEAAAGLTLPTAPGFAYDGCRVFVPRSIVPGGFDPWVLVVMTTTKTAEASVTLSFTQGPTQVVMM
jgi:hypothetical protein